MLKKKKKMMLDCIGRVIVCGGDLIAVKEKEVL